MNTLRNFVLLIVCALVSACASVGSQTFDASSCPTYDPARGPMLGRMADLAYENDKDNLLAALSALNYTLDEFKVRDPEHGTQGFLAYNDSTVVLAFTGTEDAKDWMNNVKAWGNKTDSDNDCGKRVAVHDGFYNGIKKLLNEGKLLARLNELQSAGRTVYVTGHSLGGALATLFAYYTEIKMPSIKVEAVYTFGQPLTGDEKFQECYDNRLKDRTFRFVNDRDIIPKFRADRDYRHVGLFLIFDEDGNLGVDKPDDFAGGFIDYAKSNLGEGHSMSTYLENLEKNKTTNPFNCS